MEKKVLVIHPFDHSTAFLCELYEDKGYTEITHNPGNSELKKLINDHDVIMMLGHGDCYGLYGFSRRIITSELVYLLREKEVVCVWCNADEFVKKYKLKGIYTGMIISEEVEAVYEGVLAEQRDINLSNANFGYAMKVFLESGDINDFHLNYGNENKVMEYNKLRVYKNN